MHYPMWSAGLGTRIYMASWAMSGKIDFSPQIKFIQISAISPVSNSRGDRWACHGLPNASRHQVTGHQGKVIPSFGCLREQTPPPNVQQTSFTSISSSLAALGPLNSLITHAPNYKEHHHISISAPWLVPRNEEKAGLASPHCQDRLCTAANSWLLHVCPDIMSGG